MAHEEHHVIAVIDPAKGKAPHLKQLLEDMIQKVHSHEDGALRYHMYEEADAHGDPRFVMVETYRNKQAREAHDKTQHFNEFFNQLVEGKVLEREPTIITCKSAGGFEDREEGVHKGGIQHEGGRTGGRRGRGGD